MPSVYVDALRQIEEWRTKRYGDPPIGSFFLIGREVRARIFEGSKRITQERSGEILAEQKAKGQIRIPADIQFCGLPAFVDYTTEVGDTSVRLCVCTGLAEHMIAALEAQARKEK